MKKFLAILTLSTALATPALAGNPYFEADVGVGKLNTNDVQPNQYVYGVSGGYDFGDIRWGVGLTHFNLGQFWGKYPNAVNSNLVDTNVYLEHTFWKVTPFVGLGAGYSVNEGSGTYSNGTIVWEASAGLAARISDTWDLVGQYKYIKPFRNVVDNPSGDDNPATSTFLVGLRKNF